MSEARQALRNRLRTLATDPSSAPMLMGVLNITPDSFSDAGQWYDRHRAIEHGLAMAEQGAELIDVGGESTRPGADPVPLAEELDRVLPVIEALASRGIWVSIDTLKPEVMRQAVAAGAVMLNDVTAFADPQSLDVAATSGCAVCAMHMQGEPRTMQRAPHYADVVGEVRGYLAARAAALVQAGVPVDAIMLDPGFGFGKTLAHNLALLRGLPALRELGHVVLAGLSRKSMLGRLTGRHVTERLPASLAAALMALDGGARVLRVHDVPAHVDALAIWRAVRHDIYQDMKP